MDFRHTAVTTMPQPAHPRYHLQPELVLRQRDRAFGLGPIGR
jgi:hypothetical protein